MASLLDISLVGYFSNIFVVLFIFTAVYAVLMAKEPFGKVKGVNALMAFTLAIMFLFVPDAVDVVRATVPWYIVMLLLFMFILLITTSIGAQMPKTIMENGGTWVLIVGIFILVLNVSLELGPSLLPGDGGNTTAAGQGSVATGDFSTNLQATLFHPKVLGLMVIMLVGVFAVLWIGYVPT